MQTTKNKELIYALDFYFFMLPESFILFHLTPSNCLLYVTWFLPFLQIRNHIPDLSRTIAGLILSSNDPEFHSECASLLGLQSNDACTEETVDSCIREKIIRIIEMNDGKKKKKIERGSAPCLFECEGHLKEHCPEGKDDDSEEGTS